MTTPTTWTLALITSLAAHVSAAALVAAMLHPDPTPDQPPPQSQLRIETQQVARSKATPEQPNAPEANAASTKGQMAAEGVVPFSKATTQQPQSTQLAAAQPSAPLTKAMATPAIKLAAAAAPPVTKAAASKSTALKASTAPLAKLAPTLQPAAQTLMSAALPATLTKASPPAAEALLQAPDIATPLTSTAPATQPLPLAPNTATSLASTAPDAPSATQSTPDLQLVAAAPTKGTHMTAALAWTGSEAQIDPASLKAIQSFMQPGDTKARSDETHDALSAILTSVPCARLQAEFNPATGSLDLRGHVPDAALKGPILKALQDQLGTGIKVNDALLILPRPQCGALSGIADVGLPQSQDQNTNPRLIGADAQARAYAYTQGQPLVLDLATPDYNAYIYVDYFAADGSVIHLIPNDTVSLKLRPAKSALRVGAPDASEPFLNITVGPPYGQEIATAFAASAPLYDGTRPLTEPATPYLDWLKTRVTEARATNSDFKGEWVYFFVSTRAR